MEKLYRLFITYREWIVYGFWGVMTTIVNYVVFFLGVKVFHINYLISNVISWMIAVAFAYLTNKVYVFRSNDWKPKRLLKECIQFISGRVFSLIVEMLVLYLFVEKWMCRSDLIKIFASIIVVLINYLISKFIIFKK